jgi:N-acetylmuramoyl-L-alanine amidase CwlD
MRSRIVAIFGLLLWLTLILSAIQERSDTDWRLSINRNPVPLLTPIITVGDQLYLPIRDVLGPLKGTLTESRKYNAFVLSLPNFNLSITLKPNRKDITVNTLRHYLPAAVLLHGSRLYVPIPELFNYLGFSVSTQNRHLFISPQKYTATTPSNGQAAKLLSVRAPLPRMEEGRLLHIAYEQKRHNISGQFFYKNDILFANLTPFFRDLGYSFEPTDTGFLLSKTHHTIQFFLNQNNAISQFIDHQTTIYLSAPPIKKNGSIYLPVASALNAFFYALEWTPQTRTIQVLSIINDIDFLTSSDRDVLQINSTHPLTIPSLTPYPWSPGYTMIIPNTKLLLSEAPPARLKHGTISKYSAKQISPTETQIKILGHQPYNPPYITLNSLGLEINFVNQLSSLKESKPGQFKLQTSGRISPSLTHDKKHKKVIVDVPYTISNLPKTILSPYSGITKIRTSQYQTKPPKTRIVFDLKSIEHTATLTRHESGPQVTFKYTTPSSKTKPIVAKQQRRSPKNESIKKSHYSHRSVLKGKIIVIDAGHGGKDPGAIGAKRYQEKFFTLDIAKRLQRKLAKQGAVVIMTRRTDKYRSLQSRVAKANRAKADIFISIHINSFLKSSVNGTETYYYKYKDRKLATHIQNQLLKDLKSKNLRTKRARLYVLRHTKMPAALLEPLFLTHPQERRKVITPSYRDKIAQSIFQGITNYFKY